MWDLKADDFTTQQLGVPLPSNAFGGCGATAVGLADPRSRSQAFYSSFRSRRKSLATGAGAFDDERRWQTLSLCMARLGVGTVSVRTARNSNKQAHPVVVAALGRKHDHLPGAVVDGSLRVPLAVVT